MFAGQAPVHHYKRYFSAGLSWFFTSCTRTTTIRSAVMRALLAGRLAILP